MTELKQIHLKETEAKDTKLVRSPDQSVEGGSPQAEERKAPPDPPQYSQASDQDV